MNWSQLKTILWLRWRLARNQWSRGGQVNLVITIFFTIMGLIAAAGCGIVGILAGALALSETSPTLLLFTWDIIVGAFLFFCLMGVVIEIQRSETIDINRMLHLPVSHKNIFLLNYIASHFSPAIVFFLPGMLGLAIGLTLGRSWGMIWLLAVVLSFVFMITAWIYCLRGWLAALMINQRRRRTIIAVVTFAFIILSQLPNIFNQIWFNRKHHRSNQVTQSAPADQETSAPDKKIDKKAMLNAIVEAHNYVPFLWVGNGAMSLAQQNIWPAVLGAAGMTLIGSWGLKRAYRATFRFYLGQTAGRKITRKQKPAKVAAAGTTLLEKQLPGIPQEATAMALACFRSLTRAAEVKMMFANNVLMILIFGGIFLLRNSVVISDKVTPFITSASITLAFFGISQLMFNQFGFDRAGFRQIVLLPTPRKYVLLGKNLANFPIVAGIGIFILMLVKIAIHISWYVIVAAIFQLATVFLVLSMVGNLISIFVPYRIAPGTLKLKKVKALTMFFIFASHSLFPTAMLPAFIPPALGLLIATLCGFPAVIVNLFFSIVLLAACGVLYYFCLAGTGNLLLKREKKILEVVTQEIE